MVNLKTRYVLWATVFFMIFGEVVPALLNGTFEEWKLIAFPIAGYYLALTFIFSRFMFNKKRKDPLKRLIPFFFIYGAISEWLLFGNVAGITDILGILFFGTLYIALFGIPYLFVKKRLKIK